MDTPPISETVAVRKPMSQRPVDPAKRDRQDHRMLRYPAACSRGFDSTRDKNSQAANVRFCQIQALR